MSKLILTAPMKGWSAPLDETPDAVFAERMLGDGLAIDPTGDTLHAPCDATVISVPPTGHAVSLRTAGGAEILMHVGLDTVGLGGEGFTVHVADGQAVKAGEPLIGFDLDFLARKARSLITPIVVTNGGAFEIVRRHQDREVAVGDFLMELVPVGTQAVLEATTGDEVIRELTVPLRHGLHARPAARVAALAGAFAAELTIVAGARRASAKSPVALMALAVRHGDAIALVARGPDAREAVEAVAALIAGGMGEDGPPPVETSVAEPTAPVLVGGVGLLRGVMAAPGLAIGPAVRLAAAEIVVAEAGRGIDLEQAALTAALDAVAARLIVAAESGDPARRSILAAHLAFLRDPELEAGARRLIDDGKGAGFGWRGAVGGHVEALRGLGDRRMAERVDDLIDLERQVLRALAKEEGGGEADEAGVPPPGAILLADELLPSQLMGLDAARLGGLVVAKGGPTSHVAILAAAMGLPAVVAVGAELLTVSDGASLILDADAGTLRVGPDAAALEAAQTALAARQTRKAAARSAAHQESRMADGVAIEIYA
ncbi:MAG: ptsP, partial [Caulobacter sp.]|nr:ptsP [Caulobacter sp.]